MDKEQLIALGLDEESADKVLDAHKKSLAGNYIPKARFDEVNTEYQSTKEALTRRDEQLTELQAAASENKELQTAIEKLKTENKKTSEEADERVKTVQKHGAISMMLADDVHDAQLVMSLLKLDDVQVSPSGEVAGLKSQLDALREEKPFLFVEKTNEDGAKSGELFFRGSPPPEGAGGSKKLTPPKAEDIGKQIAARRKSAIAAMQSADEYYFKK